LNSMDHTPQKETASLEVSYCIQISDSLLTSCSCERSIRRRRHHWCLVHLSGIERAGPKNFHPHRMHLGRHLRCHPGRLSRYRNVSIWPLS
jgi:hypothetical protein